MENKNQFPVRITGRISSSISVDKTAEGKSYTIFSVVPPDSLYGDTVLCIAYNTRAELLERFSARGELIRLSGFIGSVDFLSEGGRRLNAQNVITATGIEFPKESADKDEIPA